MEEETDGIAATTAGISEAEEVEMLNTTAGGSHGSLPSSTSGQNDTDTGDEAVSSSSDVSSTTLSGAALHTDLSVADSKEFVPVASSDDSDATLWSNEWERPEGGTEGTEGTVGASTGSAVAAAEESPFTYTQPPEIVIESESDENYQSDPSTESYFSVSAETLCIAGVETITVCCYLHQEKLLLAVN